MRRYDEAIDVRRGLISGQEAPTQFLWRDRLWVVRDIVSHWIETGAWWEQTGADLLDEVEIWRVEARRGRENTGVFDLAFDWALGQWHLVRCAD
ncbi:MAG: nucleotidyltransferase [Propionibacteriales bacterium]|nr:nucleotidyltransferase [Propionibacteriales bacterium]